MNLILDGLPAAVGICGTEYPIETGFRTGILFEEMLRDDTLSDTDKILTAFELYYHGIYFPADQLDEAVQQMLWFYRCGAPQIKQADAGEPAGEIAFSYEHDADYIYAAFMSAYRIDLSSASLHWWQFRALFRALPDDTQLMKIISYRTMKISSDMPKKQRAHYQRLKKLYALPMSEEQAQAESDLTEILMKGGNASKLLNK